MIGPTLLISDKTHAEKYRGVGESFKEYASRVAFALKDNDEHYFRLREILCSMRFLPAGRIQAAIGASRHVTAINCFASGTIADNYTGPNGIMERAVEAAQTMRMGGGIGYDFSTLRPRGELIKTLQSRSSGPVSFMEIYDAVCRCTSSAGHRRGAQMAVLRVDHPDVEEFIRAKQNSDRLTGFNISVGVTDDFMGAVEKGEDFQLKWNDRVYKVVDARTLWETIMRSTWDYAEPGVLFLDTINRMNNLWYCEEIFTTNPCAEQPLPPHGACLLGSFNLPKYIKREADSFSFDWNKFRWDIPTAVRAMDNVIEATHYPLPEQEREEKNKRRMGLGVTGLANAGETLGYPYGSEDFVSFEEMILSTLAQFAYEVSVGLAVEKGTFPLYDRDKYLQGKFIKTLPEPTQSLIYDHGIRNSHLLSIAPTGTISLCADNISSGVEPVIEHETQRMILEFDGPQIYDVIDYGWREFGIRGKRARECSIDDHLNVLEAAYRHIDSAVSKTCNVSSKTPWEEFKNIYFRAWKSGCKGCATFNNGGKRNGIFLQDSEKESSPPLCTLDPSTGRRDCGE